MLDYSASYLQVVSMTTTVELTIMFFRANSSRTNGRLVFEENICRPVLQRLARFGAVLFCLHVDSGQEEYFLGSGLSELLNSIMFRTWLIRSIDSGYPGLLAKPDVSSITMRGLEPDPRVQRASGICTHVL